jgi:hypothetical protein
VVVSQPLDVGPHRGIQSTLRSLLGTHAAKLLRLSNADVADMVEIAHTNGYTAAAMASGWRKSCLDTLDPAPILRDIEAKTTELKDRQQRKAAAREQVADAKKKEGGEFD